jgi:hypothetical protein
MEIKSENLLFKVSTISVILICVKLYSHQHAIEVQAGVFSTFMFMEKNPIDFKLFLEVIRSQNIFLRLIEDPEKIQSTLITRLSHLLNCKSICWALSGNIPSADR